MDVRDLAFIKSHNVEIMFYPEAWDSVENIPMSWSCEDFPPSPRSIIPDQPGVYAFVVEPDLFSLSAANGLFYIGKAKSLYQRIGAYTRELRIDFSDTKRPRIWLMLDQWNGRLKYYYSVTDHVATAENHEDIMLKALRPPFNKRYDAATSQVMRAFS